MSTQLFDNIVALLKAEAIQFEQFEHEPVYTSATASAALHHPEEQGTKSLALISKSRELVIATVAGNERIDFKNICAVTGIKRLSMCAPEVLSAHLGTELGGLAPFGYHVPVRLAVSMALLRQPFVFINPGRNDVTIRMTGASLRQIMERAGASIFE